MNNYDEKAREIALGITTYGPLVKWIEEAISAALRAACEERDRRIETYAEVEAELIRRANSFFARAEAAEVRAKVMGAALKPFADLADKFFGKASKSVLVEDDDRVIVEYLWTEFRTAIRVIDLRRARAALSPDHESRAECGHTWDESLHLSCPVCAISSVEARLKAVRSLALKIVGATAPAGSDWGDSETCSLAKEIIAALSPEKAVKA